MESWRCTRCKKRSLNFKIVDEVSDSEGCEIEELGFIKNGMANDHLTPSIKSISRVSKDFKFCYFVGLGSFNINPVGISNVGDKFQEGRAICLDKDICFCLPKKFP